MTAETLLRGTDLFLLDLDGTLYLDEKPIGDMPNTLSRLRAMGKRLVFLTNNSSKTEAEYRAKLKRIGLLGEGDLVYTSGMAMADHLVSIGMNAHVFLVATDAVKEEFALRGVTLEEENPQLCVLAYDTGITFEKFRRLDYFLRRGVPFFATHPDDVCPTAEGSMPDVGSFLALLKTSSGRSPSFIAGKPGPLMANALSARLGVPFGRMCMVGDRMHTDIRFANRSGIESILVLSGETTAESMKQFPDRPSLVLEDLNRIFG